MASQTISKDFSVKSIPAQFFLCGTAEVTNGDVTPHRDRIQIALEEALRAQGVKPTGPQTFIYHLREPLAEGQYPLRYQLEIGFPVPDGTRPTAGLAVKKLEPFKCASLIHRGPVDTIGQSYHALHRSVRAQSLKATGRQERDVYFADEIAELQTEVE